MPESMTKKFKLESKFSPAGDQPTAIKKLVDGANKVEGLGQDLINDKNVARMFLGSKE